MSGSLTPTGPRLQALGLGLLLLLAPGCDELAQPPPEPGQPSAARLSAAVSEPAGPARHEDAESGISFVVPRGLVLEAQHFDLLGPAGQIKHSLTLSALTRDHVSIDVWLNPAGLPLARWFEENLSFVRDGHALIQWARLTRERIPGMLIRRPRSDQAFGQRIALLAAKGRVLRVTCYDEDDPRALSAFEQVLDTLGWESAR